MPSGTVLLPLSYLSFDAGEFWLGGTRVSLDSVVYAFWNGQTAESIVQSFPTLSAAVARDTALAGAIGCQAVGSGWI